MALQVITRMPLTAQVAPHPALKDQATARSHTELGSDEHDDEEAVSSEIPAAYLHSACRPWRESVRPLYDCVCASEADDPHFSGAVVVGVQLMLMARKGSYDYLWRQLIKDQVCPPATFGVP
jgi:hypothetical protein